MFNVLFAVNLETHYFVTSTGLFGLYFMTHWYLYNEILPAKPVCIGQFSVSVCLYPAHFFIEDRTVKVSEFTIIDQNLLTSI